jgi:hypothetical protein
VSARTYRVHLVAAALAAMVAFATSAAETPAPPPAAVAPAAAAPAPQAPAAQPTWSPEVRVLEPKAVEILKAMSARLAGARTLSFTAVVADEAPSRLGPPLLYASRSEVVVERPDRLRVITTGAGPRSDFFVVGTRMSAWSPAEGLLATATVPPTLDGALEAAHRIARIYFPFTDLVVADPWGDLAPDVRLAFYIGKSSATGGVATDMVAFATDDVFVQAWIGEKDRLPRRMRAVYLRDPGRLRHEMDLGSWKLDGKVPASTFQLPAAAQKARPMPFEPPASAPPPGK